MTAAIDTAVPNPRLQAYLDQLRAALAPLPPGEAEEIVRELRSHLLDVAQSDGAAAALATLGAPGELARLYLTESVLARAQGSRSPWRLLRGLLLLAPLSAASLLIFLLALAGYLVAASLLVAALIKPFLPAVGLWLTHDAAGHLSSAVLGLPSPAAPPAPMHQQELLGWWLLLVGPAAAAALLLATNRLVRSWIGRYRATRQRIFR